MASGVSALSPTALRTEAWCQQSARVQSQGQAAEDVRVSPDVGSWAAAPATRAQSWAAWPCPHGGLVPAAALLGREGVPTPVGAGMVGPAPCRVSLPSVCRAHGVCAARAWTLEGAGPKRAWPLSSGRGRGRGRGAVRRKAPVSGRAWQPRAPVRQPSALVPFILWIS